MMFDPLAAGSTGEGYGGLMPRALRAPAPAKRLVHRVDPGDIAISVAVILMGMSLSIYALAADSLWWLVLGMPVAALGGLCFGLEVVNPLRLVEADR